MNIVPRYRFDNVSENHISHNCVGDVLLRYYTNNVSRSISAEAFVMTDHCCNLCGIAEHCWNPYDVADHCSGSWHSGSSLRRLWHSGSLLKSLWHSGASLKSLWENGPADVHRLTTRLFHYPYHLFWHMSDANIDDQQHIDLVFKMYWFSVCFCVLL